ncbi:MAG TPA: molybdopterin-dependent oxidoreductase [Methanocorpusculum sp.]|nr:molybdopterin-dependent oxidoreductase [Methanocorpusculum sp.]HJK26172.1 molybdopterin-dependent oxidoreductase [Methanocorpusculum sp.]HJK29650.1 molybdopterin-dependent oxidoreductase [Methanocorpusculum sp.]HJK30144.1 molybdopterin-dependent oxidoreductase [Methanocorpusculum sp.]HJK33287.1 molybdopterin-dependent oxidoreductase [Methanocorpusculum sp.]
MEMEYVTTTCPYCGTGCGLNLIVVNGKAVGVAPYHRSPVSSGKLCTRGLHAAKALTEWRIEKPCVRGESVTWDVALTEAKKISGYSGDEIAVAISSRLTNEAMFLALRYAREVLGAGNIGVVGGGCGKSTGKLSELAKADVVLMIGDVMKRLPVTGNKLYHVQKHGGKLLYLGPESYTAVQADATFITEEYTTIPAEFTEAITVAANPVVMYLAGDAAAAAIATNLPAKTAVLYETNNGRGAALLGLEQFVLGEKTKALFIITETPEREEDIYADLIQEVNKLEMIVAIGSNATYLSDAATVLLPSAALNEYPGTVTNWEGRVQKVRAASAVPEDVKCPCEIISLLSDGKYAWEDKAAIFADLAAAVPAYTDIAYEEIEKPDGIFIKEE